MSESNIQRRIQDHYVDPFHYGRCVGASHAAEATAECAEAKTEDVVSIELRIASEPNGRIEEIWFEGAGCRISQAFASMLTEYLEGKSISAVVGMELDEILSHLGFDVESTLRACCHVAFDAVQLALTSPCEDDLNGPTFGGPDLGDEC